MVRRMLVGGGVGERPGIFALLVAFMWVFGQSAGEGLVRLAIPLGAGIAMGLGGLGPGVGAGSAGARACEGIGRQPRLSGVLTRTMLIGQAISQSTAVYSLVIALLLIFVAGEKTGGRPKAQRHEGKIWGWWGWKVLFGKGGRVCGRG